MARIKCKVCGTITSTNCVECNTFFCEVCLQPFESDAPTFAERDKRIKEEIRLSSLPIPSDDGTQEDDDYG